DHYRVSQGGKPTFSKVVRGIELMTKHGVEFNTLTVVNNINAEHPLEVYRFLKDLGSQYQQFIPIVEQMETNTADPALIFPSSKSEKELMPFSVSGESYGNFMIAIFDEWVRQDVGRIYIQMFDNALASWVGEPSLCIFKKECGRGLVIERNGDVYSCDHYVYPEYKLGNVLNDKMAKMADSKFQKRFGLDKANVGAVCESCTYRKMCNGGCPKHRIHENDDGSRQNHLCPGYKKLFAHIDPYMKYMARELTMQRAPANVMSVADQIAEAS
ncbi:MAG: SPASM domain-containing protein, partial [Endozoicomonas sp.]